MSVGHTRGCHLSCGVCGVGADVLPPLLSSAAAAASPSVAAAAASVARALRHV